MATNACVVGPTTPATPPPPHQAGVPSARWCGGWAASCPHPRSHPGHLQNAEETAEGGSAWLDHDLVPNDSPFPGCATPPPPDVGSFPHHRTRLPLQRHHGGGRGINMTQIMTIMTRWRGGTNVLQVYTYLFIYFSLGFKKNTSFFKYYIYIYILHLTTL